MKKARVGNSKQRTIHISIFVILIAQSLLLVWLASSLYYMQYVYPKYEMQNILRMNNGIEQIRKCHDYNLTPCDDLSARQWNAANPDKTVPLSY